MFDVPIFALEKVLTAFVHELKRDFEVFDRHHFDAKVFHAHEELDNELAVVERCRVCFQFVEFVCEALSDQTKSERVERQNLIIRKM